MNDHEDNAPVLPNFYEISDVPYNEELLNKWINIPYSSHLELHVTRETIDRLFFGLSQHLNSTDKFMTAVHLALTSQGKEAGEKLKEANDELRTANTNIRHFFAGVFGGAVNLGGKDG